VDLSSTTNIKHPLKQPMLVIGGLACGIISGLMLSLTMAPHTTEPKKQSLPIHFNTAQLYPTDQATNSSLLSSELSYKHAQSVSTLLALTSEDTTLASSGVNKSLPEDTALTASEANKSLTKDTALTSLEESLPLLDSTALAYLQASKSLPYDSKTILASINNTHFNRPNWSWSREDLSVANAPIDSIFGATDHAVKTIDISAQQPSEKIVTKQNQAENTPRIDGVKLHLAQAFPTKREAKQDPKLAGASSINDISPINDMVVPEILAKDRLVVVLDPGHGGIDPGSEANNGLVEKILTLDMARRVELFLSEVENVDVVMTRNSDVGMSRQNRVNKIKAVGADVVVSLHFNHLPQTDINLVESFYADRHNVIESLTKQNKSPSSVNLDYTDASRTLAHIMHNKVFNEVANANAQSSVIDAGVKSDTLFVLTRSFTPGVLLELTCISNPAEAERLVSPEYRNQLAASIADGLRDYLVELHSEKFDELLVKLDL